MWHTLILPTIQHYRLSYGGTFVTDAGLSSVPLSSNAFSYRILPGDLIFSEPSVSLILFLSFLFIIILFCFDFLK